MPWKPVSQMTKAEHKEYKAYMREAKKRSRSRLPEGTCIVCGGPAPKRNGRRLKTCDGCNKRSHERDARLGYPMRPSVTIKRGAVRLRKAGSTVSEIVSKFRSLGANRQIIVEVLREADLL